MLLEKAKVGSSMLAMHPSSLAFATISKVKLMFVSGGVAAVPEHRFPNKPIKQTWLTDRESCIPPRLQIGASARAGPCMFLSPLETPLGAVPHDSHALPGTRNASQRLPSRRRIRSSVGKSSSLMRKVLDCYCNSCAQYLLFLVSSPTEICHHPSCLLWAATSATPNPPLLDWYMYRLAKASRPGINE